MFNCKQNSMSNHYIPTDLLVMPLGKFKGKYDTRRFRCYKKLCHDFNFRDCPHCKYLPYTSSPLRNNDYYCENIEIKHPILKSNNKHRSDLDSADSNLSWLLKDFIEDTGERNKDNENISYTEQAAQVYFVTHLPLNLFYPNLHQLEKANLDKALVSLVRITNKIRSLMLVSSLKKNQ